MDKHESVPKSTQKGSKKWIIIVGVAITALLLIVVTCFVLYFGAVFLQARTQKTLEDANRSLSGSTTPTTEQLRGEYDPIVLDSALDTYQDKYAKFEQINPFPSSQTIYQSFQSGSVVRIVVPLQPVARNTELNQNGVMGLQLNSSDYVVRWYHIIKLSPGNTFCDDVSTAQYVHRVYPNATVGANTAVLSNGGKMITYSFPNKTSTTLATQACYDDGDNAVWFSEMFYDQKQHNTYDKVSYQILDSFRFVR